MFDSFGWTIDAYSRVAVNDPSGPLADAAKMALGNVHFRDYNFEAAAEDYRQPDQVLPQQQVSDDRPHPRPPVEDADLPGRGLR